MSSIQERGFAETLTNTTDFKIGDPLDRADADMRHVLGVLEDFGGKPVDVCLPFEARRQRQPSAAVTAILTQAGRDPRDDQGVDAEDFDIPGPEEGMPARIYRSRNVEPGATRAIIQYIHGGGWVVGDLDSADATPRMLAKRTGAIVISTHYRQAPQRRFPAAHDDSLAAWRWIADNARQLGGDPTRMAIVGAGVGGNMALNIALQARDERLRTPVYLVLIHPVAGNDMTRPSYVENLRAKPLNTPIMQWYVRHSFNQKSDLADPRINLCEREDLAGLPPVTLVLAEIDPLRSEGEALADALGSQGVKLDFQLYEGVTHDFFGMGQVVNKAMFAEAHVSTMLTQALSR